MPENQTPAAQPEPGEFNFTKPVTDNPRIRRRSLKAKPAGLPKPTGDTPATAHKLENEAPSPSPAATPRPQEPEKVAVDLKTTVEKSPRQENGGYQPKPGQASGNARQEAKTAPSAKVAEPAAAPPRVIPSSATMPSTTPVSSSPAATSTPPKTSTTRASSSAATSPHGTRPATLYYSSSPRKTEDPSPMKTTPTASTASTSSSTTLPSSLSRPATSSPRPATNIDYRANVERQTREQKSVGSILTYVVYGLIAFFVLGVALAGYGANVIFKQIHDQSVTVADLDQRYSAENKDLNAKLATTQDTLSQAQAQIARQQDLILKQQEELNRLIAATSDNASAIKAEKQARAQEGANLRAEIRDLQYKGATTQKY